MSQQWKPFCLVEVTPQPGMQCIRRTQGALHTLAVVNEPASLV